MNDTSKIEKLEEVYDELSRTETLTEDLAEETQLFIRKTKKYICLGYWVPSMKSGKISWPCEKAILEKAYAQDIIYYYIRIVHIKINIHISIRVSKTYFPHGPHFLFCSIICNLNHISV